MLVKFLFSSIAVMTIFSYGLAIESQSAIPKAESAVTYSSSLRSENSVRLEDVPVIDVVKPPTVKSVVASYYGNEPGEDFHGKVMANGEPFNKNNQSLAAHRKLPFGTRLTLQNPVTEQKVVVVISDRGPFKKGRQLDVSYAAAKALGFVNEGLSRLDVKKIELPREVEITHKQALSLLTSPYSRS